MSSKETVFNVRVNSELKERFKKLADDHKMTMSELMRRLMQLAISSYEYPEMTKKEPGMTRINMSLVLTRPDLSVYDLLYDPEE